MQLQKEKAELEMRLDDQIRAYQRAGDMTVKLQEEFEASKKMVMEIADSMDNRTREGMMGGGRKAPEGMGVKWN